MALQFETTTVPEGLEAHYTAAEDGKFRLNVEGVVPASQVTELKEKVNQFRTTNTELLKKQSALEAMEAILGEGGLKPTEVEKRINDLATTRANTLVEEMKNRYEGQVKDLNDGLSKRTQKLNELQLTNAVVKAASAHGVRSSALEDVQYRASRAFSIDEDGNLKYNQDKLDADGKAYTVDSWLKELAPTATHLFEANQGTGTPKNARTSPGSAKYNNAPANGLDKIQAGLAERKQGAAKRIN